MVLFDKNISPCCAYCEYGRRISDTEVACIRKGIVSAGSSCRKFTYDPLRREPVRPAAIEMGKYSEEDFTL